VVTGQPELPADSARLPTTPGADTGDGTTAARGQHPRAQQYMSQLPKAQLPKLQDDPIGDPPGQASAWNIANALTVLRLLLVPVFVVVLFLHGGHQDGWRVLAWAIFALACVTDTIDGDLARKRGLVTDFGKLADPIADKALVGAALIGLSVLHDLPWWVTVVVLVREVGVTLLRFWVLRHGVIPASRGGKIKTLLQNVAIGLFVLPPWVVVHDIAWVVMIAAVIIALATGLDYVARAVRLRRESLARAGSADGAA
jgi:CDP-diacylglycerol--glycerol-3-phosphate 3-phosphatidyltransferase